VNVFLASIVALATLMAHPPKHH